MKKYLFLLSAFLVFMPILALAQETAITENNGVTLQELEVADPGILPNSPLYFLKNLSWGIQRLLTFDSVRRAELELNIINQKAAEIKKLSDETENSQVLQKAVENYKESADRLRIRFEALKETSENPNVDKLLSKLTDRVLKHSQLFEELKAKNEDLKDKIEDAKGKLEEITTDALERLDRVENLKERLEKTVEMQRERASKEIRALEVLGKLEERAKSDELRQRLSEVKNGLVEKIEIRFRGAATSTLGNIVGKEDLEKMIKLAEGMINDLKARLESGKYNIIPESVRSLLERTSNNLINAKTAFKSEKYGEAFGQANAAVAGAKNAIAQLSRANSVSPDGAYRKKLEDLEKCGPQIGAPGNWVCKDGGWKDENLTNVLPKTWTIEHADNRFIPSEIKIKKGDTVTWVNKSGILTWPASAMHPTHRVYPGFDALKGFGKEESYSFVFDRVGSWRYHDHLSPSSTGVVVVE
ncbi:MAG: DUF5667 domain-containing protein [Candidatus Azambacteria bacterium]|nr:DUF5667 domain-containing protein [Candidatus Azambacteria bacterium]